MVGLVVALLSFLPLLFGADPRVGAVAWRWLSGIAVGYWLLHGAVATMKLQRLSVSSRRRWVAGVATLLGLVLFSWNVISPDQHSPTRYIGGLLCLLAVAGSNFVVAVFAPADGGAA